MERHRGRAKREQRQQCLIPRSVHDAGPQDRPSQAAPSADTSIFARQFGPAVGRDVDSGGSDLSARGATVGAGPAAARLEIWTKPPVGRGVQRQRRAGAWASERCPSTRRGVRKGDHHAGQMDDRVQPGKVERVLIKAVLELERPRAP